MLLAISSLRAISRENIRTSCPCPARLSASCSASVVLPSEEIAPSIYSPSYSPPSSMLSRLKKPVLITGVLALAVMPSKKSCICAAALVCKYFSFAASAMASSSASCARSAAATSAIKPSLSIKRASFASFAAPYRLYR